MQRFQVIKCNPNFYKGLLLKWNSNGNKVYIYQIDPRNFKKWDTLLLFHNQTKQTIQIVNKIIYPIVVQEISLVTYDAVEIIFSPIFNIKAQRKINWALKAGTNYTINLEAKTQMMNLKKFDKKRSFISRRARANNNQEQSQQVRKVYWQKCSDMARNQFSRFLRYNELVGMSTDLQLKRNYIQKFKVLKYLSWKLQMSIFQLKQNLGCKTFSQQFNNSLMNWLIMVGFYETYTSATNAVTCSKVLVNGKIVTNKFYQIKVNDIVSLIPIEWKQINLNKVLHFSNSWVQLDLQLCSFIVLKLLETNNLHLNLLNDSMKKSQISGKLLDPMNTIFMQNNLVDRIFHKV